MNLLDFQVDPSPDKILKLSLQQLDLLALLANDQSRSSYVQDNLDFVSCTFDLDPINPRVAILRLLGMILDEVSDLVIFDQ